MLAITAYNTDAIKNPFTETDPEASNTNLGVKIISIIIENVAAKFLQVDNSVLWTGSLVITDANGP